MDKLFTYGSLQPGGPKEHVLADLHGHWQPAVVRGRLIEEGWGADLGYPGLVLDDQGEEVHGQLLTSSDLSAKWPELDAFEGEQYRRVSTEIFLQSGERTEAEIYVLRR